MALDLHTSEQARKRLKRRYAAEARFRAFGLGALLIAFGFLAFFLFSIIHQAYPAFFQHYLTVDIALPKEEIDPNKTGDLKTIGAANFDGILRKNIASLFPADISREQKRTLTRLVSSGAPILLRNAVMKHSEWIGGTRHQDILLDDNADLYLKGQITKLQALLGTGTLQTNQNGDRIELVSPDGAFQPLIDRLRAPNQTGNVLSLDATMSSLIVRIDKALVKVDTLTSPNNAQGSLLLSLNETAPWQAFIVEAPEGTRKLDDRTIMTLENLKERGLIRNGISKEFFTLGASREAEMAGIWSAMIGSLLTLFITLMVSFPLSVAAAIYLEEFAPKTRFTELIEVNINNLAAVPSIIFGLLGLAVFLNLFGMPRSAPLVGGLVLALMTLPIIIIASRAALRSVPPSVKEGALAIGASHMQAVFHHVLPLAVPGILTGSILGTARALGETAPLLLIGMVAFVVDTPKGFLDAATLLPVQIFMWNDFPEAAFQQKTAAAILMLLLFLAAMNFAAVLLRRKFEQRW